MLKDIFSMALIHMKKRPMRSILTIFQVTLGIATIALIFNIVFMMWSGIQRMEQEMGDLVYELRVGSMQTSPDGMHEYFSSTSLTTSDLRRIKEIDTIEYISPITTNHNMIVKSNDYLYQVSRIGYVGSDFLNLSGLNMVEGSFFTQYDYDEANRVSVIERTVANMLFPGEDAVGKKIEILREEYIYTDGGHETKLSEPEEYTIIGVYHSPIQEMHMSQLVGNQILLPYTVQAPIGRGMVMSHHSAMPSNVQSVAIRSEVAEKGEAVDMETSVSGMETEQGAEETDIDVVGDESQAVVEGKDIAVDKFMMESQMAEVEYEAEHTFHMLLIRIQRGQYNGTYAALNSVFAGHAGDDTQVELRESYSAQMGFTEGLRILSAVMIGFGLLIVVISSIGILSTMMVNILERTKQVGIEKALGASRGLIFIKFSVEAVLMSFTGGLLGLVVAYFLSGYIMEFIDALPISLERGMHPMAIIMSLFVSVVAGWIFGMYPAFQAAKLQPTEALRQR